MVVSNPFYACLTTDKKTVLILFQHSKPEWSDCAMFCILQSTQLKPINVINFQIKNLKNVKNCGENKKNFFKRLIKTSPKFAIDPTTVFAH